MKKRPMTSLLLCLLTCLLLCALSGCGVLPQPRLSPDDRPAPAALSLPEDMLLTWDPAAVAVEKVEVTVSEGGPDSSHTVTVIIQMAP